MIILRRLVSVAGLSPIYRWAKPLSYDIVKKRFNKAKIIIYADSFSDDSFKISFREKSLYIYGYDDYTGESYYTQIKLWFKIKEVKTVYKNGILTVYVKGKRFWIF